VERWIFPLAVIIVMAAKLWLTSEIRIVPQYAPHDALNFVEHAKNILLGKWFGDYDDFTLIKQPFYPIYLAGIQKLGLALPAANQLFYGLACVVACIAVRPLVRNPLTRAAIFAFLCFNPMTYATFAWIAYRSPLNAILALLSIACAFAILVRRNAGLRAQLPWLFGLGFSFAAFWLTREESVWLVPGLVTILAAYLWQVRKEWPVRVRSRLLGLAVPVAIWLGSIGSIMLINGSLYGWYTTAEIQASEFVSGYNSLARIVTPVAERHVPVPRAAREIAYAVSPAARELGPYLDGRPGRVWAAESCQGDHVCNDIGGGWFVWALRNAVDKAGHYTSGTEARRFYLGLARELDDACGAVKIQCRPKRLTLAPPIDREAIPSLIADFGREAQIVVSLSNFSIEHWEPQWQVTPPVLQADYEFVVGSVFARDQPPNAGDAFKKTALVAIARLYQWMLPWGVAAVALLMVFEFARRISRRRYYLPEHVILFVAVLLSAASLLGLLAIVDTLSFPAVNAEYMSSVFPPLFFALALTLAIEGTIASRLVRRRLAAKRR